MTSRVSPSDATRPPHRVEPQAILRGAVRRAGLAPAGVEPQPWLFRFQDADVLELCVDRRRASTVADPVGREAVISCGAALLRVRVALHAAGHAGFVELLPDATDRDLLARIRVGARHVPTPADDALVAAFRRESSPGVPQRRRGIAPHLLSLLLGAARVEGAWLGFVDLPALRGRMAELVLEAHRQQREDPRRRHERARRAQQNDGALVGVLPAADPGAAAFLSYLGLAVPRAVGRYPALPARVHAWVARAATIAVLTTRGDSAGDWLIAGQALARVLLTARAAGVAASYLNEPVEIPALRARVAELVRASADPAVPGRRGAMPGDARPQVVLCLDHTPAFPSTTVPDGVAS